MARNVKSIGRQINATRMDWQFKRHTDRAYVQENRAHLECNLLFVRVKILQGLG
jgi:hypothetical protein